jgi:hypothetical protein
VRNGKQIDQVLRDVLRDLPADQQKEYGLEWNYARHGAARIHKMRIEEEDSYLAIRDDVLFFGMGKGSLPAIKKALDGFDKRTTSPTPLLEVHLANAVFLDKEATPGKVKPGLEPERRGAQLSLQGGKDLRLVLKLNAHLLPVQAKSWSAENSK